MDAVAEGVARIELDLVREAFDRTAVGLVVGYLACLVVDLGIIRLDAEVYYIDKLPVKIDAVSAKP